MRTQWSAVLFLCHCGESHSGFDLLTFYQLLFPVQMSKGSSVKDLKEELCLLSDDTVDLLGPNMYQINRLETYVP